MLEALEPTGVGTRPKHLSASVASRGVRMRCLRALPRASRAGCRLALPQQLMKKLNARGFGKCGMFDKKSSFPAAQAGLASAEVANGSICAPASQPRQLPSPCQSCPPLCGGGRPLSPCQGCCLDAIGGFFLGHHDGLCFADTCSVTGAFLGLAASTQTWLTQ